ncbi:MAG: hypothetical protein LLF89_09200 [Spirochaetaceae bacterium]|nr:hypothetical protein [Spirochaetaceae bacterium]
MIEKERIQKGKKMAKMFKCDVTGKTCEGEAKHVIEAELTEDVRCKLRLFKKVSKTQAVEMDISPEAEEKVIVALKAIFNGKK